VRGAERNAEPDPTAAHADALGHALGHALDDALDDALDEAHADAPGHALDDAQGVSARPARVVYPNTARGRPGSTGLTGARVEARERRVAGPARGR